MVSAQESITSLTAGAPGGGVARLRAAAVLITRLYLRLFRCIVSSLRGTWLVFMFFHFDFCRPSQHEGCMPADPCASVG